MVYRQGFVRKVFVLFTVLVVFFVNPVFGFANINIHEVNIVNYKPHFISDEQVNRFDPDNATNPAQKLEYAKSSLFIYSASYDSIDLQKVSIDILQNFLNALGKTNKVYGGSFAALLGEKPNLYSGNFATLYGEDLGGVASYEQSFFSYASTNPGYPSLGKNPGNSLAYTELHLGITSKTLSARKLLKLVLKHARKLQSKISVGRYYNSRPPFNDYRLIFHPLLGSEIEVQFFLSPAYMTKNNKNRMIIFNVRTSSAIGNKNGGAPVLLNAGIMHPWR